VARLSGEGRGSPAVNAERVESATAEQGSVPTREI